MDLARLILGVDTRGLRDGERDLNRFSRTAAGVAGAVGAAFAGIGAGIGFGAIIQTNAEFGKSMSQVAAISGATGAELERLRETALQMGADTSFSASQAADALGLLAQAGFTAAEAIEAVPQVLALAAAGGLGLAEAADIASNVMNGFGLSTADAARIADVLAQSAASTNASVQQMGQSMSTAAPIAAALGISMEETAAAIGVLSDAGLQGEVAGTALRGVFASLAQPTDMAREALAKYGLTAQQVDPQTVGISRAMATLAERGLSTADAFVIFGREAASGALVMAENSERVRTLTGEFQNAKGAAEEMARVMRDNLAGDLDALSGSVETMVIRMGDGGLSGSFRSLAQAATSSINFITANMQTLSNVIVTAGGAFAAYRVTILATNTAMLVFNSSIVAVIGRVGILTTAKLLAARAAGTLNAALAANPFGAVAVAVGVLAGAFITLANSQAQARAETNNLILSLRAAAQARSADFLSRRAELQGRFNQEQARLRELRREQANVPAGMQGSLFSAFTGSGTQATNEALSAQNRVVSRLRLELQLADESYAAAGKAAEAMAVPTAQAATAVGNLGGSIATAGGQARTASNDFQQLYDRLFPYEASVRQLEADEALIRKNKDLTEARKEELLAALDQERFRRRTAGLGDATVSKNLLNEGPLVDAADDFRKTQDELARDAEIQTVRIARSFAEMSQSVTSSLQGLTNSIRNGDILGILGGVLDIVLQLGSAGLFGSGFADRVNRPRSFDGGGFTGAGSRSGGLDGKGGFLAMLHPNETVIDHHRGQRVPANDTGNVRVLVGIDPRNGNVTAYTDSRIAATAPAVANLGSQQAQAQLAQRGRRRVR